MKLRPRRRRLRLKPRNKGKRATIAGNGRSALDRHLDRLAKDRAGKAKAAREKLKPLTVLVGGTRRFTREKAIRKRLDKLHAEYGIALVVTGANYDRSTGRVSQAGPDRVATEWAEDNWVTRRLCFADWQKLGRSAGPIRNEDAVQQVLKEPGKKIGLFFWDGKSPGTRDTIRRCRKAGIKVKIVRIRS